MIFGPSTQTSHYQVIFTFFWIFSSYFKNQTFDGFCFSHTNSALYSLQRPQTLSSFLHNPHPWIRFWQQSTNAQAFWQAKCCQNALISQTSSLRGVQFCKFFAARKLDFGHFWTTDMCLLKCQVPAKTHGSRLKWWRWILNFSPECSSKKVLAGTNALICRTSTYGDADTNRRIYVWHQKLRARWWPI